MLGSSSSGNAYAVPSTTYGLYSSGAPSPPPALLFPGSNDLFMLRLALFTVWIISYASSSMRLTSSKVESSKNRTTLRWFDSAPIPNAPPSPESMHPTTYTRPASW